MQKNQDQMHDEKTFLRPKSQKRQHTGKDEFHFGRLIWVAKERVVRWCSTQDKGCGAKTDTDCQQLAIVQGVL